MSRTTSKVLRFFWSGLTWAGPSNNFPEGESFFCEYAIEGDSKKLLPLTFESWTALIPTTRTVLPSPAKIDPKKTPSPPLAEKSPETLNSDTVDEPASKRLKVNETQHVSVTGLPVRSSTTPASNQEMAALSAKLAASSHVQRVRPAQATSMQSMFNVPTLSTIAVPSALTQTPQMYLPGSLSYPLTFAEVEDAVLEESSMSLSMANIQRDAYQIQLIMFRPRAKAR